MCEAVDFFKQSLAEEGLDAEITSESTESTTTLYVSKNTLGGERHTVSHEFVTSFAGVSPTPTVEKRMAMEAREVAQQFDEWITETVTIGNRKITLKLYETPEATCERCNATVGLSPRSMQKSHTGEMSVPQPMPLEAESIPASFDAHAQVMVKLYLIGKLRESCQSDCPNSS